MGVIVEVSREVGRGSRCTVATSSIHYSIGVMAGVGLEDEIFDSRDSAGTLPTRQSGLWAGGGRLVGIGDFGGKLPSANGTELVVCGREKSGSEF